MCEQKCCPRGDDLFCSLRRGGVGDNGVKPVTTRHLDLGNGGADKPRRLREGGTLPSELQAAARAIEFAVACAETHLKRHKVGHVKTEHTELATSWFVVAHRERHRSRRWPCAACKGQSRAAWARALAPMVLEAVQLDDTSAHHCKSRIPASTDHSARVHLGMSFLPRLSVKRAQRLDDVRSRHACKPSGASWTKSKCLG